MDPLFDPEFGYEDIKRGVENSDNLGLTNDGTVSLRKVCDQHAEEQVSRLLLSKVCGIPLAVSVAEDESV